MNDWTIIEFPIESDWYIRVLWALSTFGTDDCRYISIPGKLGYVISGKLAFKNTADVTMYRLKWA
jgi:hypothetical protein